MYFGKSGIITIALILIILLAMGYVLIRGPFMDRFNDESDFAEIQSGTSGDIPAYTDLDGNPFDLASLTGKPLVINGWASWCPFCVEELPLFAQLQREFGDRITVVAINRKESAATARAFLEYIGTDKLEGVRFLLDPSDFFYRTIEGYAMPETVFYNEEGIIIARKRGSMTLDEMRSFTEDLLESTGE